jgi:hypothetical protein
MANEMKIGKNPFPNTAAVARLPLQCIRELLQFALFLILFLILLLNVAVFPACQNKK